MDTQNIIDTVSKILSYLTIFETIAGVIFNMIIVFICLKSERLRTKSTFKILAVGAINDMLISIPWNLNVFLLNIFNYYIFIDSHFYCRWISNFLQYTTLSIESWILLSISVDRLLSMVVKKWSKFYFSGYRPYIFSLLLCFSIAGINFFEVFTVGYSFYNNQTQTEMFLCYASDPSLGFDWYTFSTKLALYFGYLIPVALLIVVNFLIIYKATKFSREHRATGNSNATQMQSEKKKAQMTRMILFLTFCYIAVTLPEQIFVAFIINNINISFYVFNMVFIIINFIQFFYPSFHIFILLFSNKLFFQEVKEIILRIKSSRVAVLLHISNQTQTS